MLVSHRIWKPTPLEPLDIEGTIEWYLRQLHSSAWLEKIVCDPFQLHRSITTLQQAGLPIEEYPQNVPNCTRMGQVIFDLLNGRNIRLYPAADMREQALHRCDREPAGLPYRQGKDNQQDRLNRCPGDGVRCGNREREGGSRDADRV